MVPVPVESSVIASIAYDSTNLVLQLKFRSEIIYNYFEVPPSIYEEFMAAESKGSYFNEKIRDCFSFKKEIAGGQSSVAG